MGADRDAPRGAVSPGQLRRLAEAFFEESHGAARGLLRDPGDICLGSQGTGLGPRELAVIRRPARRGGYSGLLILQPCVGDPSGQLRAAGSSILIDGRAVPRLAALIADFMESELAAVRANEHPPASRAGGIPPRTPPAVTPDQHDRGADPDHHDGAA
jgi:hypothetical protein